MNFASEPHRCPKCHALVVDRRSPVCTTCRTALPADWIMTPEQAAKMMEIDRQTRSGHVASLRLIDPANDPNTPAIIRLLDSNAGI